MGGDGHMGESQPPMMTGTATGGGYLFLRAFLRQLSVSLVDSGIGFPVNTLESQPKKTTREPR